MASPLESDARRASCVIQWLAIHTTVDEPEKNVDHQLRTNTPSFGLTTQMRAPMCVGVGALNETWGKDRNALNPKQR